MDLADPIAIVGAGMAGAACAARLYAGGARVQVFEKARGIGGRLTQRRIEGAAFDLGAQFYTARDPEFVAQTARWQSQGVVARWLPRLGSWRSGQLQSAVDDEQRWVGTPAMSAPAKALLGGLPLAVGTRIAEIRDEPTGVELVDAEGQSWGPFAAVVVSAPAAQAQVLLATWPDAVAQAASVVLTPCIALGLSLPETADTRFDAIYADGQSLSWCARDSSKPGRPPGQHWMVHAAPQWSAQHWDSASEILQAELTAAFFVQTGIRPVIPVASTLHRWRYAQAAAALDCDFWLATDGRAAMIGDWLAGNRVEGAWRSGVRCADALLARLRGSAARQPH